LGTKTPGVHWTDSSATLVVKERDRRAALAFGKACLAALPALLLLQANARAALIVPVAIAGLGYGTFAVARAMRMEFRAGPEGVRIRNARTRTLPWADVDAFVDAFVPDTQKGVHWALGVKTTEGEVIVAEATACGKRSARPSTLEALRNVANRYGLDTELDGGPTGQGGPAEVGWHPDPDHKAGSRFWDGSTWYPVRRYEGPGGVPVESWDPRGDPETERTLLEQQWQAACKQRNIWIAITAAVVIGAGALWASENHPGGSFTLSAWAFFAALGCAFRVWNAFKATQAFAHLLKLEKAPPPVSPADASEWPAPITPVDLRQAKRNHNLAFASLMCALVGFFAGLGLLAIFLGVRARRRLRRTHGPRGDLKMATAGIWIGALTSAILVASVLVAVLSHPPSTPAPSPQATLANESLLHPADYPHGWVSQGPDSGTIGASFFGTLNHREFAQVTSCLGTRAAHVDTNPTEGSGPQYSALPGIQQMTDTTDVFSSTTAAHTDFSAAASPAAPTCLQRTYTNDGWALSQAKYYVGQKVSAVGTLVVLRRDLGVPGTDYVDLESTFPYTWSGTPGVFYQDNVFVWGAHRVESNLSIVITGTQPPLGLVVPLVRAAEHRLARH
jgi:hypothetical protein